MGSSTQTGTSCTFSVVLWLTARHWPDLHIEYVSRVLLATPWATLTLDWCSEFSLTFKDIFKCEMVNSWSQHFGGKFCAKRFVIKNNFNRKLYVLTTTVSIKTHRQGAGWFFPTPCFIILCHFQTVLFLLLATSTTYHVVFRILRLRRNKMLTTSFDSLLSRAGLGHLGKGWIVCGTTARRLPYWANGLFYPSWDRLYRFTVWPTAKHRHIPCTKLLRYNKHKNWTKMAEMAQVLWTFYCNATLQRRHRSFHRYFTTRKPCPMKLLLASRRQRHHMTVRTCVRIGYEFHVWFGPNFGPDSWVVHFQTSFCASKTCPAVEMCVGHGPFTTFF